MKRVLVTGANGFIGRHLSSYLSRAGYEVAGMGHGFWTENEWRSWGVSEWFELDINISSLLAHANKPYAIFHCAGSGSVGFSIANPMQDFERTVDTTLNVLEYIRTLSPETILVYPSSAAVYGMADHLPIHTDANLNPTSPYGFNKKIAEDICKSYGKEFGIRYSIVRLFSVYGAELRKQLLWDSCGKILSGDNVFFGTGEETRDWIHVSDAASLMEVTLTHAVPEGLIVNGGSGVSVRVSEVIHLLFQLLESHNTPVFNRVARPGDPKHYQADISKSVALSWQPSVSWQKGIEQYVHWFSTLKTNQSEKV